MKTATIPSLRVEPTLRQAAESVLEEGETLSGFVEQSIEAQIAHRLNRQEFLQRGLAGLAEARASGKFYTADEVLDTLDQRLAEAKQGQARQK